MKVDFGLIASPIVGEVAMLKMFYDATIMVKAIILLLVLVSMASWAIIFSKLWFFAIYTKKIEDFEAKFSKHNNIREFCNKASSALRNPLARVLNSGFKVLESYGEDCNKDMVMREASSAMQIAATKELSVIEKDLSLLATIASTSPFIGLFGTVWGIMTSFQAIANAKNTSLVVVAPGIAEALLVTAVGLFAAIPALIFYNKFSNEVGRISTRMDCFVETVSIKFEKDR